MKKAFLLLALSLGLGACGSDVDKVNLSKDGQGAEMPPPNEAPSEAALFAKIQKQFNFQKFSQTAAGTLDPIAQQAAQGMAKLLKKPDFSAAFMTPDQMPSGSVDYEVHYLVKDLLQAASGAALSAVTSGLAGGAAMKPQFDPQGPGKLTADFVHKTLKGTVGPLEVDAKIAAQPERVHFSGDKVYGVFFGNKSVNGLGGLGLTGGTKAVIFSAIHQ